MAVNEKSNSCFETADLDLAAYLAHNELKFLGSRVEYDKNQRRAKAVMRFEDPRGVGRDLERSFISSAEKQYRDHHKWFLREAHKAVADFHNQVANFNE